MVHRYWIHLQLVTLTVSRLPNHPATIRIAQNAGNVNSMRSIVLLCMFASAPVMAQDAVQIVVYSGIAAPVAAETFSTIWDPGINFGAGIDVELVPRLDAVLAVGYNRFGLDARQIDPSSETQFFGGKHSALNLTGGFSYDLLAGRSAEFYVAIRAGAYFKGIDNSEGINFGSRFGAPGITNTSFGITPSLGVAANVNESIAIYAEPQWVFVFAEEGGIQYLDLHVGLRVTP